MKKLRCKPEWRLHQLRQQYGCVVEEVILCVCREPNTGPPCHSQSFEKFRFQRPFRSISTALIKIYFLIRLTELYLKNPHLFFSSRLKSGKLLLLLLLLYVSCNKLQKQFLYFSLSRLILFFTLRQNVFSKECSINLTQNAS
jgi:hypothetical protein